MSAVAAAAVERPAQRWIVTAVVLASFGPYILRGVGLRSEHVLLYGLMPVAVALLLLGRRTVLSLQPMPLVLGLLAWNLAWMTMVTAFLGRYTSGAQVAAQLENMMQPLAVIVVVGTFVRCASPEQARAALRHACRLLILMLVLNTALSITSMFTDVTAIVTPFLRDEEGGVGPVWIFAAQLGRFTGIFNQPMESGLTYSLGLLAWGYLARTARWRTMVAYAALVLMIVGGALSASKVFIAGGIPLFILYVSTWNRVHRIVREWRLWAVLAAGVVGIVIMMSSFQGLSYFARLAARGDAFNVLMLLTGGRLGSEGTDLKLLLARVWAESPFFGLGFGVEWMFDSAYVEFYAQGGFVSLLILLLIMATLGWAGLRWMREGYEDGRLLFAISVLIVGAGMGAPTITINRFSTVLWAMVVLIFEVVRLERERAPLPRAAPAPLRAPAVAAA